MYKELLNTGKGFIHHKKSLYIIAVTFLVLISCYFIFFDTNDLVYFPDKKHTRTTFYTDSVDNGHSYLQYAFENNSSAGIEFVLREGFNFPYSGLDIAFKNKKGLDISKYNTIKVRFLTHHLKQITLYLAVKDDQVKDTLNRLADRRLNFDIDITSRDQTQEIKLSEFSSPNWWYTIINQPKSDFKEPQLDRLVSIGVATGVSPQLNQPSGITVAQIKFLRDNSGIVVAMVSMQLALIAALFALFYIKNHPRIPPPITVDIHYKPVPLIEKMKSGHSFLEFINEHYSDPELSLLKISRVTGVSQRTISDTIAEKYDCNFKSYINQIRIVEAKRLLLNSDLNISEIAYKVGFNSPTSFNRVFKIFTNTSPSEFLESSNKQ